MKQFKLTVLVLLAFVMLSSCSKNHEVLQVEEASQVKDYSSKDFLDNYYGVQNFTIVGNKQINVEGKRLLVHKIVVEKNKNKVGYLVMNEASHKMVYFVDADNTTNRVYIMDFRHDINNYVTFSNNSIFFEKNFMQRLGVTYTSYRNGGENPGRFWGWACGHAVDGYRHCCYY